MIYFDLVESFEYFPAQKCSSFKLRFFNIVAVCLYLTLSYLCNFHNTMTICNPVGVIHQPFRSGNGDKYGIEFVRYVVGRELKIHKLWIFAVDGITRKVHPFACVDVGKFSRDCFQTYYMTEEARRVTIFGQISINASVKWLVAPVPFYYTTRLPCIDNILVSELRWGDGGNSKTWALQTQYGVSFGGISVPWSGVVPFCAAYLTWSPVNTRTERDTANWYDT